MKTRNSKKQMENSHEYRRRRGEERRGPQSQPQPSPAPAPAPNYTSGWSSQRATKNFTLKTGVLNSVEHCSNRSSFLGGEYREEFNQEYWIWNNVTDMHLSYWNEIVFSFPSIFTGRHEVSDPQHQSRILQNSDEIPCSCSSSGERMGDVPPGIRAELPCERIPFPLWLQRANSDNCPSQPERVRWLHWQRLDFR